MREARFDLKPWGGGYTHHPSRWDEPDARMVSFHLVAFRDGEPFGGGNTQARLRTETWGSRPRGELRLSSGWWVFFVSQFAHMPAEAAKIIGSVEQELSAVTAQLEVARGPEIQAAAKKLWDMTFHAHGLDYWK